MKSASLSNQLLLIRPLSLCLIYLLSCLVGSIALHHPVSAVSCNEQYPKTVTYGGTSEADDGRYEVYLKLPKRGQQANVKVFHETFDPNGEINCEPTKSIKASGDAWVKVDTWDIKDRFVSAHLVSHALPEEYGANRPILMLISVKKPVCQPTIDCHIEVDGQTGIIVPATGALDQNGLVITVPRPVTQDVLDHVDYYVDDVLVYTTPKLERFDMRYVSFANQKLTRIMQYTSGQQVVINDSASTTHADSFANFLFRVFYTGQTTSKWLAVLACMGIILATGYVVTRKLLEQRNWRIHHGFIKERELKRMSTAELERAHQKRKYLAYAKKSLITIGGLCLVVLVLSVLGRYVIAFNQVDGSSMEETLKDGRYLVVNRTPVTWSNLIGKQFKPKRGTIVTIKEVYGNQSGEAQSGEFRTLVKRVIGLPGERIVAKNGQLTVYNQENPNGFNPDASVSWSDTMIADLSNEILDIQLAQNEVFVIGDNRLVSVDSRANGPIALSNIQGELVAPLPF